MKINMWMIANRLHDFDIETDLEPEAAPVLDSVLPFYAPGCVSIVSQGDGVLCKSEQGNIYIPDLSLNHGYFLIQSIFNWYQDWFARMSATITQRDYTRLAEVYRDIFGNPVMIQDSSYRLLGMSHFAEDEEIPPGWEYLQKNGQSSYESYAFMTQALRHTKQIYRNSVRKFKGNRLSAIPVGGLHANIYFQGRNYAKVTVLEMNRRLNRGDVCVLESISQRLATQLAACSAASQAFLQKGTLEALVDGEEVDKRSLDLFRRMADGGGRSEWMAVMLIGCANGDPAENLKTLTLVKNVLFDRYPSFPTEFIRGELMVLVSANHPKVLAAQIFQTIRSEGYEAGLTAGLSLRFTDLTELKYFFEQAEFAKRYSTDSVAMFLSMAPQQLIELNGKPQLCACAPVLRRIWLTSPDKKEYLDTLRVYLEEERAAKRAADRLFIHKNTLTYRIKYLKDITGWDFDNPDLRNYLRLSLYVLGKNTPTENSVPPKN